MPPIVYLPGAGGTVTFWKPVAERLTNAGLGPAVRFGWPGFGDEPPDDRIRSVADLVAWVLARMPPGPCNLVAQSMGGVVAALIALEHAERVRRLVLCTTSGGIDVASLGAADWRPGYRAEMSHVPDWFVVESNRHHRAVADAARADAGASWRSGSALSRSRRALSREPHSRRAARVHPRWRSHVGEQSRRRGRAADPRAPRATMIDLDQDGASRD